MNTLFKQHILYYASLALVLLGLFVVVILTPSDTRLHMGVVVLMSFFYVFWAIIHHLMHHDFHVKIVLEYVLIGMVGITFVYFVLASVS